jgi:hypothetical protein
VEHQNIRRPSAPENGTSFNKWNNQLLTEHCPERRQQCPVRESSFCYNPRRLHLSANRSICDSPKADNCARSTANFSMPKSHSGSGVLTFRFRDECSLWSSAWRTGNLAAYVISPVSLNSRCRTESRRCIEKVILHKIERTHRPIGPGCPFLFYPNFLLIW